MKDKTIWLTGASAGIGKALALKLAGQGAQVYVTARDADALNAMAQANPNIIAMPGDVTDHDRMHAIASNIENLDCVILNAGYYKPDAVEAFNYAEFEKHVTINLLGVGACLDAVLPQFLKRNHGHIAITASVAGFHGLPKSLSYGPTKAALINMAEALCVETQNTDIKVQVINPGFVKTRLTDQNEFEMPFLMTVEDAAGAIVKGLQKNTFEITFPWVFSRILRSIAALPYRLSIPLIAKLKP